MPVLRDVVDGAHLGPVRTVGDDGVPVSGVTIDSRTVRAGALFCALRGARVDAHDLVPQAVAAGATAVCVERPLAVSATQVVVPDTRVAVAHLAASFHGHPSRSMTVVGVTGTNGKTTVTHLLGGILRRAGMRTEVLGTLTGRFTTPEAPDLQAALAAWRDDGVAAVAMEVSSHALALHRADATEFSLGVFTNLTPEHLDFHGDMEAYFAAKARLFEAGRSRRAVVNVDDPYGRRLAERAEVPVDAYSAADAEGLVLGHTTTFRWRGEPVELPLQGRFNVANALAAMTAAAALGVPTTTVVDAIARAEAVPGRMQSVSVPDASFRAFVDYAHTPDGLAVVLSTARELAGRGRVLVVFGCGGDRDRAKRPLMGEVAGRLADVAVLTSDNPRSEDPAAIISDVQAGMERATATVVVEGDRRTAIEVAVAAARPGDVLVVAGKGHEATQTVGDRVIPFDDRAVLEAALASVHGASSDDGSGTVPR